MGAWLADDTLDHLRDVADWPDLGERYRVDGRLGSGGTATVFAVHDVQLDRDVAVKVIDIAGSGEARARLAREARVLAGLEHPGIVPVHDAGVLPDGRVYYVMKRVRGRSLQEWLAEGAPLQDPLAIAFRIADAVSFAHARGVVHGDLAPGNIMIGPFGEVLVMDWGVAAALSDLDPHTPFVAGTPGFMAPEQAAGHRVDERADVYGLGALLRAMAPRQLARPLAAVVDRATSARPAERYESVAALAADLDRFRRGGAVEAYREGPIERVSRVVVRYKVPICLVLAYMVMRVLLIIAFGR